MKILTIIDPIDSLKLTWDSTIYLLRELEIRGHDLWLCIPHDIYYESNTVFANATFSRAKNLSGGVWDPNDDYSLNLGEVKKVPVVDFDVVLLRKEPPFDTTYLYLTYLLEIAAKDVPIFNHPRGVRNSNEKLSILKFAELIPATLVSSSTQEILSFQEHEQNDLVIKPLDQKGGKGVFRLALKTLWAENRELLNQATRDGATFVMAQTFVHSEGPIRDKRILIFEGELWAAYERHARAGDFRANVAAGGTYHTTQIEKTDREIVQRLSGYLKTEGILFAGIDVLTNKLIEINVTCSAGLCEMKMLHPERDLVGEWAAYLETFAK